MAEDTRYAAFISYAHTDENIARRLHLALETYAIPKGMDAHGKLSPIFRDVTELTAHHSLSEKIKNAVENSGYLIVVCSPAAKKSHWVNEEIRLFRKTWGEAFILSVIIEGTPKTAFPPALLEGGREPLAANISGGREGFRFGVTQLAASMLGVGLDRLVQRDAKRRRARMRFITAASLVFSVVMGGMAWTALDARDAAQVSQVNAETSRAEAEKLVEYMIKDLKDELAPMGKLEILDGVGDLVVNYYAAIPLTDMDDDRLARQAKARHILGQVAIDQGKMDKAETELKAAYAATKEVLRRTPDATDAIFAHAQSEFWLGSLYFMQGKYEETLPLWQEYDRWGQHLYKANPNSVDWIMEAGWGQANLGLVLNQLKKHSKAQGKYEAAINYFKKAKDIEPDNISIHIEYANALAGLSNTFIAQKQYDAAYKPRYEQVATLTSLSTKNANNFNFKYRLIQSQIKLMDIKDQNSESCNIDGRMNILDELLKLLQHDQSNLTWKRNYGRYWFVFLDTCYEYFAKSDFDAHAKRMLDYTLNNLEDRNLEEKMRALVQLNANSRK